MSLHIPKVHGSDKFDAWRARQIDGFDSAVHAVSEVQSAVDEWLSDYNEARPHESLGHVPPTEFKPRHLNA
jgi:transposase InsO family protein